MDTLGITGRLARASARRPGRTLALWAVLLVLSIVAAATLLGDSLTQEGEVLVELEAETAEQLIEDARMATSGATAEVYVEYVVISASDGSPVDTEATATRIAALASQLRATEHVAEVVGPAEGGAAMQSDDGTYALLQVTMADDVDPEDAVLPFLDALEHDRGDGLQATAIGEGSVEHEFSELAEETLVRGEMLGLAIALVVLVIVFGALVAAVLPIVLAILSIILALGLTALVGTLTDVHLFVMNMITMIGLAVGIDYSLFVVQRVREERAAGHDTIDAITIAGSTATRAVLFSGITVVVALLGMLLVPDTVFRSLGIGAITVVVSSVLGALTLLPAVLGLLGHRIDSLRLPLRRRRSDTSTGAWARLSRSVMARPIPYAVVAITLLLGLAVPYARIELGSSGISSLPDDNGVRQAYEVLTEELTGGLESTSITITADDVTASDVTDATNALVASLESNAAYGEVSVTAHADRDLAVIDAVSLLDPSTDAGREAVTHVRSDLVPDAFGGTEAEVLVTGMAAWDADYVGLVNDRTPVVFAFVLGLSFLLLLLAFRSIVVPLKAIVMNLLSVGAAYGLLVLVFQEGWGAGVLGFQTVDVIDSWLPLFLFSVLFGLSMDYHVFLLSRIREHYDRTGDNTESVAHGLSVTGSIITGAALIMLAVFGGFATGDLSPLQQMGFGLGVAVLLDATVVRSILVPATMALLGDRNWYLPTWLEWLPHLHVEGRAAVAESEPVLVGSGAPSR